MRLGAILLIVHLAVNCLGQNGRAWSPLPDKALLRYEGVRRELKLSTRQAGEVDACLRKWMDALGWRPAKRPATRDEIAAFEARMKANQTAQAEYRDRAYAILTNTQKTRLKQLELQMSEGPIFMHPEIARALNLTSVQTARLTARDAEFAKLARTPDGRWRQITRAESARYVRDMVAVLTPAQNEKWRSMVGRRVVPVDRLSSGIMNPRT